VKRVASGVVQQASSLAERGVGLAERGVDSVTGFVQDRF
jgi:hypothetical protein